MENNIKNVNPRKGVSGPIVAALMCMCLVIGGVIGVVISTTTLIAFDSLKNSDLLATTSSGALVRTTAAATNPDNTARTDVLNPAMSGLPISTAKPMVNQPIADLVEKQKSTVVMLKLEIENGSGYASAFIISEDGYAITNNHVVEDSPKVVAVMNDGTEYEADIVGRDVRSEIAVIKIKADKSLPVATLGISANLRAGETIVAIGSPNGIQGAVTSGIVSVVNKIVDVNGMRYKMIQTDAALNPGNSGGPLFNLNGEVVGIVTRKDLYMQSGTGYVNTEGLSYAVPIDNAIKVAEQIIRNGKAIWPGIGITGGTSCDEETGEYNGVKVITVKEGSVAETAGIKVNDRIVKMGDTTISIMEDVVGIMNESSVGDKVTLTINRDGEIFTTEVILEGIEVS